MFASISRDRNLPKPTEVEAFLGPDSSFGPHPAPSHGRPGAGQRHCTGPRVLSFDFPEVPAGSQVLPLSLDKVDVSWM